MFFRVLVSSVPAAKRPLIDQRNSLEGLRRRNRGYAEPAEQAPIARHPRDFAHRPDHDPYLNLGCADVWSMRMTDQHHVGRGLHERNLRSEEHTSELQSRLHLVCRLLLEKKKKKKNLY